MAQITKENKTAEEKFKERKHFSLVRNFHLADFITLGNGACGSLSIFSNMQYLITHDETWLWWSMYFLPIGTLFDVLDGRVARWRKNASLLGQELDSLADLISFGVAPAVCAFAVGMRTFVDTIVLAIFISCGIARLARYNATVASIPKDASGKINYFEGTPIPTSLFLVATIAYLTKIGKINEKLPGGTMELFHGLNFHPFVLIYALSGTAM
ncbi:8392_t:CDS:2, partial [Ambispora leptoticha]